MNGKLILAVVALALISSPILAQDHDASFFLHGIARRLLQTNGTGNSTGNSTGSALDVTDAVQVWTALHAGGSNFTILAPTNQAFVQTFSGAGIQVPSNFTDVLTNQTTSTYSMNTFMTHVIVGLYSSQNITNGTNTTLPTLLTNSYVTVSNTDGNITFTVPETGAKATVVQADVPFGGNIVHIVNGLLIPAATNGTSNGTTGNGTVPAPTV